jgi:predicted house-cleaning noncanonical NTP pyrophosphatase (MazG superfamily)
MKNEYPKLVRDLIPEIIKQNEGVEPKTRILEDDAEYLDALAKKIVEEAAELQSSLKEVDGNFEEKLADIFEVIYAILKLKNKSIEDVIPIHEEKRKKRGGFDKRILMLEKANTEK